MLATCVILICQCLTALSQYDNMGDGYRADITFDESNDRFDVTDIIGEQNKHFHDLPEAYEEIDGRRHEGNLKFQKHIMNNNNRRMEDFAYHEKMETVEYGDADNIAKENFEKNLAKFKPPQTRRNDRSNKLIELMKLYKMKNNSEFDELLQSMTRRIVEDRKKKLKNTRRQNERQNLDQLLLNYGMPLNMKVSGFIPLT